MISQDSIKIPNECFKIFLIFSFLLLHKLFNIKSDIEHEESEKQMKVTGVPSFR